MPTKSLIPLCLLPLLVACQQPVSVQGEYTQLTTATAQKPLRLKLEDGRLSGFTGCNNAMGNYSLDRGELVVSQLASTMMACSPEIMQREQQFSQLLQQRPRVSIDGKILTLSKDDTVYQFSLQPDLSNASTRLIYVAPERKTCTGVGKMQCLQVRDSANDNWQLHYGEIEGFSPEPGIEYRVRIKELPVANPPADAPAKRWILDMIVEQKLVKTE
ncbi:DUF4377 domain-containing protein [Rheinheimera aquimaris]|uniref:DUF4377 domain-containing protein n=1 Tax=Rheinheimera aquimaris TaxID=412437 RepID=UPI003A97CD48